MRPNCQRKIHMFPKETRLNLGCGSKPLPDYFNVDLVSYPGVDLLCDLTLCPWPFANNSIHEIQSSHFFEHVPFLSTFSECYRILQPGGICHFSVPYLHGPCWINEPTHITHFSYNSFHNWEYPRNESGPTYGVPMKWLILRRHIDFMFPTTLPRRLCNLLVGTWINACPDLFERFFSRLVLANQIHFTLQKII